MVIVMLNDDIMADRMINEGEIDRGMIIRADT